MTTASTTDRAAPAVPGVARRRWLRFFQAAGALAGVAGALAVAAGGVLPWARLTVFGVVFGVPGVFGLGALTLSAALLALLAGRRFPLLAVVCGLLALGLGLHAQRETGKALRKRTLALESALWPVNDRLIRAGLSPVEPFPPGQRRADLVGPGPDWTLWGGAVLALGGLTRFAAQRLACQCPRCKRGWPAARRDRVTFCPACGERVGPFVRCPSCAEPVALGDVFCGVCRTSLV